MLYWATEEGGVIGATAAGPCAPSDDHHRELRSLPCKTADNVSSANQVAVGSAAARAVSTAAVYIGALRDGGAVILIFPRQGSSFSEDPL
eukprot:3483941-Pleurochrysis_carterae.AAC.1